MATLMITAEARGMYRWIHETYGIGLPVKAWCQRLADQAIPPTDGGFDFLKLWDDAGELAASPDEVHLASAVAKIGIELYNHIRHQLSQRKGADLRAANEVFWALDGVVPVEVTAVYEVSPAEGTVAFLFLDSCKPVAPESTGDPTERELWR